VVVGLEAILEYCDTVVEAAWNGYIALVTRLHTKPGKKEHGGGNGEGRRKGPTLGNILR